MQNIKCKISNEEEKIKEIIKQLLVNRGVTEQKEIGEFLNPQLSSIEELIAKVKLDSKELGKAVERIHQAIDKNEPIIIHGDYDVDGICGTAILWEAIYYGLGYKNVIPFIPHRIDHGYGLTIDSIEAISNEQSSLIITTDCGISAVEAIKHAKSLGFDVIITDHHTKGEKLPDAIAILHTYDLVGAGIAYLLAQTLIGRMGQIGRILELVALATIADLQPLLGVNRILTKYGLEELNQTERVGLQALMQIAGVEGKKIGPYEVGWILAPRLNAMGRLEDAMDSLRLLCTKSSSKADELAEKLNHVNKERRQMTEKAYGQARESASQQFQPKAGRPLAEAVSTQILVLHHKEWHEGIIGLVAAKITEEFYRPTIAIAKGETVSKGSARSINGINIIETIRKYSDLLIDVGGHEMAAGFSIETEKIEEFESQLSADSNQLLSERELDRILKIDLELNLSDITPQLYQQLKKLEPHGIGNPHPTFLTRNVEIVDLKTVGQQNKHLKLKVKSKKSKVKNNFQFSTFNFQLFNAIGFNLGDWVNKLSIGDHIDIVYQIQENTFNGYTTLQLKLKDLCKSPC